LLAEQLRHNRLRVHASRDGVAVLAVAREDPVVGLQGEDAADDGRLFADVEVAVAADLRFRVLLLRALFEATDQLHLAVQPEQEVAIVLGQLERLRVDRAWSGGWGGGLDGGDYVLLPILQVFHLPTRWGGGAEGAGGGVRFSTSDVNGPTLRRQRRLHQRLRQRRMRVDREVDLLERQAVLDG